MGVGMDDLEVEVVTMIVGTSALIGNTNTTEVVVVVITPMAEIMDVVTVARAVKFVANDVTNNNIRK